jgi:hypothetical protein
MPHIELDQLSHVSDGAHRALDARHLHQELKKLIAELSRSAIDVMGNQRGFALLALLTVANDSLLGYLIFAGIFAALGSWGTTIAIALSIFMGIAAVALELFEARLYETSRTWTLRAVAIVFGLLTPAGLLWLLLVLQHVLAVNTAGEESGADVKLWIFGAIAVALHATLFLAGGRVRHGLMQVRNTIRLSLLNHRQKRARRQWFVHCSDVLKFDHHLQLAVESHNSRHPDHEIRAPRYDAATAALVALLTNLHGNIPDVDSPLLNVLDGAPAPAAAPPANPAEPRPELQPAPKALTKIS